MQQDGVIPALSCPAEGMSGECSGGWIPPCVDPHRTPPGGHSVGLNQNPPMPGGASGVHRVLFEGRMQQSSTSSVKCDAV